MSTHKHIDRICAVAVILALLIAIVFMNGESLGIQAAASSMGYEDRLFDTSSVHTIDIVMDNWDSFIESCEDEEYAACTVVIDGEAYKNVGIRAKGNTSLSSVSSLGSDRYSFKLEFDQYDSTKSYYGLDKLSLNNLIQDNTLMKDYLTYRMMNAFGVAAPLCSYVYITVNGEDWGLYLAVEGVEDSFLRRNYGADYGELYKPDSLSFGGGRGNGQDFSMDDFDIDSISENFDFESFSPDNTDTSPSGAEGFDITSSGSGGFSRGGNRPSNGGMAGMDNLGGGMGSSDVKLQYIDDDPDSYSNIFDSAKTNVTDADQTRLIQSLKGLSNGENIENVVNVDDVLRYFVVHNFVVNGDSYTGSMIHNYYLYEQDGRLSMIPWDYNLAFGGFQGGQAASIVNDPIDTPLSVTGSGDRPMIDWIFSSEEYTGLYHQYFAEFLDTVDITALIDQAAALIAPYAEKDPTRFCTYEEFEAGVATLREFCLLRRESVEGQLNGTIPTTDEGQSADSSALIDASHITISDMGSMSAGGGMGGGSGMGGGGGMAMPGGSDSESGFGGMGGAFGGMGGRGDSGGASGAENAAPSSMTPPEGGESLPSGGMPQGEERTFPTGENRFTSPDGMEVPEGFDQQTPGAAFPSASTGPVSVSALLPLVLSAAVLILGLFLAVKYRR